MCSEVIPFKNGKEILLSLPDIYLKNPQWFTSTPKFTTIRVNIIKYTPEEVVEKLRRELLKESSQLGLKGPPEVFVHSTIRDCIVVGPWQNQGNLPMVSSKGEVIVDVFCGNSVLRGAHIFAPGVLSLSSDVSEGDIVDIYVDLKGRCHRGLIKKFTGDKTYIGYGVVHIERCTIFKKNAKKKGIAVEVIYRVSNVPSVTIQPDYGILQNLPSIICSHVLEPTCDSTVLDMCASPGNKTIHIAMLMKNMGRVVALDKSEQKVAKVISLSKSFGLTNISAYVWDSTKAVLEDKLADIKEANYKPPFHKASFNRILLDAPCSALGNRPNLYNKTTVKQLESYILLQKQLFHNAATLLEPGGILVYSTCTITFGENEGVVKWALNKYRNLRLVEANPYFGNPGLEECFPDERRNYVQRFGLSPGDSPESDTIGFFIAKFVKEMCNVPSSD